MCHGGDAGALEQAAGGPRNGSRSTADADDRGAGGRCRLVIFDLDGTLVDSLGDLADSMNAVLAARGLPVHAESAYRVFVGDGIEALARRALPSAPPSRLPVAEVVEEMRAEYARRRLDRTVPFPGMPELLRRLRQLGTRTAVLSNKPDDATRELVTALFAEHGFDAVRGARPGSALKPDPAVAVDLCASIGVHPADTAFVGDTDTDMLTGRRAGMLTIGVGWGFRDPGELVAAGAHHIVHRPSELHDLLDAGRPPGASR
jgi:phosphoglycolate phosphatase